MKLNQASAPSPIALLLPSASGCRPAGHPPSLAAPASSVSSSTSSSGIPPSNDEGPPPSIWPSFPALPV